MSDLTRFDPAAWCALSFQERRDVLAAELLGLLKDMDGVQQVTIEAGPAGREYDFTAAVETDVGRLRAPLWSHARATIFCDPSIHEANRKQIGPGHALAETAATLRSRLAVPYALETRGLTITMALEGGVTRTWTAEHSRFRKRTAVTREDLVENAGDLDVRDLLAHFYTGPALRLKSEEGEAILLPAANDVDGPLVTLCSACGRWEEGSNTTCGKCGSVAVDVVVAARPPRR